MTTQKIEQATLILEAAHNSFQEIQFVADEPGYYKLLEAERNVISSIRALKTAAFETYWREARNRYNLRNAEEDRAAKKSLLDAFLDQDGIDYTQIDAYFDGRQHLAGGLALVAILNEARKALPPFWHDGPGKYSRDRRDPTAADIVHGKRLHLHLYREAYGNDQLGSYALDQLSALSKLGSIVIRGARPEHVTGHWLTNIYGWRRWQNNGDGIDGKRAVGGPFVAAQSFKNGRFDLHFKTEEDASTFAAVLVGDQQPGS